MNPDLSNVSQHAVDAPNFDFVAQQMEFEAQAQAQAPQLTEAQLIEQERLTLWRAIAALGRAYDNISADSTAQRTNLTQLVNRLADRPSGGNTKHREPRVFNGRADQVNPFLREINNAVYLQRRSLVDDHDKVIYLSSYLADGSPASWYRTLELDVSKHWLLDDFDSFIDAFKQRFQDSDLYASALRKMRKLKQTASCAVFTNQYIEILAELDWTEQTKIQEYYD